MERASDQPKGEEAPACVLEAWVVGGRIKFRDQPKSTSGEDAGDVVFSHGRHQSGTQGRGETAYLRGRPDRVTLFLKYVAVTVFLQPVFEGVEGCVLCTTFCGGSLSRDPLKKELGRHDEAHFLLSQECRKWIPWSKKSASEACPPLEKEEEEEIIVFHFPLSIFLSFISSNLTLHHNTVRGGGIWSAVGRSVFLFLERGETPLVFRLLYSPPPAPTLPIFRFTWRRRRCATAASFQAPPEKNGRAQENLLHSLASFPFFSGHNRNPPPPPPPPLSLTHHAPFPQTGQ